METSKRVISFLCSCLQLLQRVAWLHSSSRTTSNFPKFHPKYTLGTTHSSRASLKSSLSYIVFWPSIVPARTYQDLKLPPRYCWRYPTWTYQFLASLIWLCHFRVQNLPCTPHKSRLLRPWGLMRKIMYPHRRGKRRWSTRANRDQAIGKLVAFMSQMFSTRVWIQKAAALMMDIWSQKQLNPAWRICPHSNCQPWVKSRWTAYYTSHSTPKVESD